MIKIFHNRKWLLVLFCIFLIMSLLISIFVYRVMTRKVIKAEIVNISVEKPGPFYDYDMSQDKKEELNNNLDDFAYVIYEFDIKNLSSDIQVSGINIQPIFSENMNQNVYWYSGTNAITDSEESLGVQKEKHIIRRILIKKKGLTNDQINDMARENNFRIKYNTFKSGSILSYGYNFQNIGVK